jgi:hypothetical protein
MTKEEFQKLEPGNKIVLVDLRATSYRDWMGRLYDLQEENGGFLILSCVRDNLKAYVEGEETMYFFREEIELYKEGPKGWSYERDY